MSVTWALLLHSVGPIICLLHPRWYCREAGGTVVGSIMGKFRGDSLGTSLYKGPSFLCCIVAKMTARHTASFTFSQCVFPLGPSVLFLEMDWTFFSFHRRSSTLDPPTTVLFSLFLGSSSGSECPNTASADLTLLVPWATKAKDPPAAAVATSLQQPPSAESSWTGRGKWRKRTMRTKRRGKDMSNLGREGEADRGAASRKREGGRKQRKGGFLSYSSQCPSPPSPLLPLGGGLSPWFGSCWWPPRLADTNGRSRRKRGGRLAGRERRGTVRPCPPHMRSRGGNQPSASTRCCKTGADGARGCTLETTGAIAFALSGLYFSKTGPKTGAFQENKFGEDLMLENLNFLKRTAYIILEFFLGRLKPYKPFPWVRSCKTSGVNFP